MRKHKRKNTIYVDFIDLEKVYNRVNRESVWQVLRIYDVRGKLLSGIKSMYVDSSRVEGSESKQFRIDSGVRQGYHSSLAVQCIYGRSDEVGEDGDGKERSQIPGGWKRMEIAWPLVCR